MKRTIILIVLLFIAIIVISSLYFSRLNQSQSASKRYIATIPANASLLISFNNDSGFYDLFNDYQGFEFIFGKEEMNELNVLKETFLKNPKFFPITSQQPVYISVHPEKGKLDWLISMPLQNESISQTFTSDLDSSITFQTLRSSGIEYYELTIPSISSKIYAAIQPEKATVSFSKPLLERSIDKQTDHLSELFLEKFQENNRKNSSPLQLYVNNDRLKDFLSVFSNKTNSFLASFESLNGISMLDLNYKSDVVMFSGISSIAASDSSYLSLFISQEPIAHQLKNWLPSNVAVVSTYGISDYRKFHADLEKVLEKREEMSQLREQIRYMQNKSEVVIDDELLSIWGNEFAKLTLKSGEEIGLIAVRDSLEYANIASKISTANADSTNRQFDNSNLLYYSLGDPFKNFKRPYFTYANGYLVIANHQSSLSSYLESIKNQDLLIKKDDYILYDKLQSTSSNFSLFIQQENAERIIERNLKPSFRKNYNNTDNFGYKRFYGFSIQLSGNGEGFTMNLYGKLKEE